jgi:hypothetical protein
MLVPPVRISWQPAERGEKQKREQEHEHGVALQKCRCYGKLCFIKQFVKSAMSFISCCISPEFFATHTVYERGEIHDNGCNRRRRAGWLAGGLFFGAEMSGGL